MLFLLLGTSAAWADKYYKVVYNISNRQRVETPVPGKKYMIFNTTFNGSTDFTGFLYNNGTALSVDKSRDNDRFIYNECFIFELVTVDESNKEYAIRSLSSGTYVNVEGSTSNSTPQTLLMYTWDEAVAGDGFDPSKTGAAAITENNGIKQAFVNSENRDNSVIHYNNITSASNRVFIFSSEDKTRYWSGNEDSFFGGETGQPFAFYEVEELTSEYNYEEINSGVREYLNIFDLHVYSRCDLYSAQQIYGYITDASQIKSVLSNGNALGFGDGIAENLLDGDNRTYAATNYLNTNTGHAFEIDLREEVSSFRLYLQRRADGRDILKEFDLQVSTDGTSYASVGTFTTDLENNVSYNRLFTAAELGSKTFSKIRIVATNTTAMPTYQCMGLAELYVLPDIPVINDAMIYFDSELPVRATIKDYNALLDEINKTAPAVKLLSGVPLPGNKYRIYADAYYDDTDDGVDNPRYINREVYTDGTSLYANGDYANALEDDKAQYEWYCEASTTEGKLLFRNAKYPTMYLSNSSVSTTATEWEINTSKTQRHGVPLKLNSMQYLAVFNDGTAFQGNVKEVQNQTAGSVTIDVNNTPDDATDDTTVACGLCTDFVFLPVELDDDEKQISIVTFSPLVERNTTVTYGGNTYSLPYSVIVKGVSPVLPVVTNNVPTYHPVDGYYCKDVKVGDDFATAVAAVKNGDVLELRYTIARPFYKYGEEGNYTLYRIKNLRAQGLAQQAGPNRSSINVEEGEGQISTLNGKFYCAQFTSRNTDIGLTEYKENEYKAETFFYFNASDVSSDDSDLAYSVFINSAITPFKCEAANKWSEAGIVYYVQPNYSDAGNEGYVISRTALTESNNPGDAWCSNHASGDIVLDHNANDAGAAWVFEPVPDAEAQSTLKSYIATLAQEIKDTLDAKTGYEDAKINSYKNYVAGKATEAANASDVATLVAVSQELHMVKHELDYGLQALPEESDEDAFTNNNNMNVLRWYYVKNVYGSSLVPGENMYAAYNNGDRLMTFNTRTAADYSDMTLYNLYHFAGETVNKDQYNEYLDIHVHNFMAFKDSTLVGTNEVLYENLTFTGVDKNDATTASAIAGTNVALSKNSTWEITAEFTSNGNTTNHYGTCLLTTTSNATASQFQEGFQVYLQSTGSVVVKAGTTGNDYYKFTHTDKANSKLKVVLSYAEGRLSVAVTNALGVTKTIKDLHGGDNYIPCGTIQDITQLYTNAPSGVNITSLKAENVLAMHWDAHNPNEKWYILPSSNTDYPGLAVVMKGASDANMGWSNVSGANQEVFTDLGYGNYSTWQFERVTEFDTHLEQLLELYGLEDCVIYNKELVALYNLIKDNQAIIDEENGTAAEEAAFNTVYDALRNYTGPKPEELRAPKPGKFYTIYPASDVEEVEMCVHVDKTAGEISTNEVNRTTKIVTYNGDDNVEHDEYNSRGVWFFEGTADGDGFLPTTGIQLNNLHTQTQLNALDAGGALLTEEGALDVTLATKGGAKVAIQAGGNNMARGDVASRSIVAAATDRAFETDHATVTFDWEGNSGEISKENINSNMVATDKGSVLFTTSHSIVTGGDIETTVFCTNVNGNTSPTIEHTFEFSELGDSFTFNHITLDIHAFNGSKNYQYNDDNKDRQWNVKAEVSDGESDFTEFFTLTDIDIAAGVGETGNVHQKWGLAGNEFTTTTGNLVVKLTITKGTNNGGCFFGLSEVALSNVGDVWYIEEIEEPEYIYYQTNTSVAGHSTLMLGFPTKIPSDVVAFRGRGEGIVVESRYISLISYDDVLPAMAPVILRNADKSIESKNVKFYYTDSEAEVVDDKYIYGALYYTIVDCSSFDNVFPGDVDIYMLNKNKTTTRMYRTYENYNAEGEKVTIGGTTNHFEGGHIPCKANKAFMILAKDEGGSQNSFSLRFGGDETTDIENIESEECVLEVIETIYDLQGRKLDEITEPGIYIINGKKVFIK